MYWRDVISLISTTTTTNEIGDTVEAEVKTEVYANRMSYRTKAVTQALANGLKPEYSFEVKEEEYDRQKKIEYKNITYNIITSAPSKNECIEIVCEGVI